MFCNNIEAKGSRMRVEHYNPWNMVKFGSDDSADRICHIACYQHWLEQVKKVESKQASHTYSFTSSNIYPILPIPTSKYPTIYLLADKTSLSLCEMVVRKLLPVQSPPGNYLNFINMKLKPAL